MGHVVCPKTSKSIGTEAMQMLPVTVWQGLYSQSRNVIRIWRRKKKGRIPMRDMNSQQRSVKKKPTQQKVVHSIKEEPFIMQRSVLPPPYRTYGGLGQHVVKGHPICHCHLGHCRMLAFKTRYRPFLCVHHFLQWLSSCFNSLPATPTRPLKKLP